MIYRCLFTRDITNLLGKVEKHRVRNKKIRTSRGRKAWRWWSLLPCSSLGWLFKCSTNPAYGLLLLWLHYSDLNATWSPLSLCVPEGHLSPGQISPAPNSGCSQLSQRSKMPLCFLLKQHCLLHIVICFNYAIIKKNSQTKLNALLSSKQFQRHFCSSFSFQSWHVLQSNSHFALLHSLTLLIKAIQTINYYLNELRKGRRNFLCFRRNCTSAQRLQGLLFMDVEDRKGFKGIGHISRSGTMYFQTVSKGWQLRSFSFKIAEIH